MSNMANNGDPSNCSDGPMKSLTLELLAPHRLFNRITGMFPLILIDTRSEEEVTRCCLRDTFRWNTAETLTIREVIVGALQSRPRLGLSCLVFVTDKTHSSNDECNLCKELDTFCSAPREGSLLARIHSISILTCPFAELWNTYTLCTSLFVSKSTGTHCDSSFGNQNRLVSSQMKLRSYPTEIIPQKLYLGDQRQACDEAVLANLQITHLVDASGERSSEKAAVSLGIGYLPIRVNDNVAANIYQHFEQTNQFISDALDTGTKENGRVFVHCRAGISRSTTILLAYLMHSKRVQSLRDGFRITLLERPFVCPNEAFRQQLRDYEAHLMANGVLNAEIVGGKTMPSFHSDADMESEMSNHLSWMVNVTSEHIDDFLTLKGVAASHNIYDDDEYLRSQGAFDVTVSDPSHHSESSAGNQVKVKKPFLKRSVPKVSAPVLRSRRTTKATSTKDENTTPKPTLASSED